MNFLLDPQNNIKGFTASPRARGCLFGVDVTERFLAKNNLNLMIRSHEVQDAGYCELHNGACVTVFSAPNYCGRCGNLGAVVRFDKPNTMEGVVVQFAHVPTDNGRAPTSIGPK